MSGSGNCSTVPVQLLIHVILSCHFPKKKKEKKEEAKFNVMLMIYFLVGVWTTSELRMVLSFPMNRNMIELTFKK